MGGQKNLTFQASPDEILLQWSLTIPDRSVPELRFISSTGNTANVSPLIVGQTVFRFLRTSTSPLPLVLVMVIDNVSTSLNGTRVECSYGGGMMETTVIIVIENGTQLSFLHAYHGTECAERLTIVCSKQKSMPLSQHE